MTRVAINNLGSIGVVADIFQQDTPREAWTAVRNCRMGPFGAEKFLGHSAALGTLASGWAVSPLWLLYAPVAGEAGYWLCCGEEKIYARLAETPFTETNVTRQNLGVDVDYAATQSAKWHGNIFGGLVILNNGVDLPQVWDPAVIASQFQDFDDFGSLWPSTYTAGVLRPYGRYLVALDVNKGGVRFPQLVKWSHVSDPGTLPLSWDITDPTVDAGEFSLQDAHGVLVEQRILREANLLYTTDQVWQMRWVGGSDIFGFSPLFHEQGALATNCVARYKAKGEFHLVLGGDDIFLHNGQSAESVITPAMRRWFFQQIDPTHARRSFVITNPRFSEVWVCIPESGAEQPTLALVWNWTTGAIGFRDLLKETSASSVRTTVATQGTPCIAPGSVTELSDGAWDDDTESWDSDTTLWEEFASSPAIPKLLMADRSADKKTYLLDSGGTFEGTTFEWYVQRDNMPVAGQIDTETLLLLTEVWPRFSCTGAAFIAIHVGTQDTPSAGVQWQQPVVFNTATDQFVPVYASGRYLSVRFTHQGEHALKLPGYAFEVQADGMYN